MRTSNLSERRGGFILESIEPSVECVERVDLMMYMFVEFVDFHSFRASRGSSGSISWLTGSIYGTSEVFTEVFVMNHVIS